MSGLIWAYCESRLDIFILTWWTRFFSQSVFKEILFPVLLSCHVFVVRMMCWLCRFHLYIMHFGHTLCHPTHPLWCHVCLCLSLDSAYDGDAAFVWVTVLCFEIGSHEDVEPLILKLYQSLSQYPQRTGAADVSHPWWCILTLGGKI